MYKSLLISEIFCLFLFACGFAEKSPRRYEPLPGCTEQLNQKETDDKLAQCPSVSPAANLSVPTNCCQFWKGFSCEKAIIYALPQCQSSRFLIEMQVNLLRPANTCLQPPSSCANVTSNGVITAVTETIFRPIVKLYDNATYAKCTNDIRAGVAKCMLNFDGLLDERQAHKDGTICCDVLRFKDCAKKVSNRKASCLVAKIDLDSLYVTMEKNVAKKCPAMGPHCNRAGAPNLS